MQGGHSDYPHWSPVGLGLPVVHALCGPGELCARVPNCDMPTTDAEKKCGVPVFGPCCGHVFSYFSKTVTTPNNQFQ